MANPMIGQLLDRRYRVIKLLGSSLFGETFLAADTHRPNYPQCVVKKLHPPSNNPNTYDIIQLLFKKKAEMLEKLGKHDRLPQLLAFFEEDKEFYLVEEFITGTPLSEEIVPGVAVGEEFVSRLLIQVLEILTFIHEQGALHGNIKPHNIIRRNFDQKFVLINLGAFKEITSQIASSQMQSSSDSGLINSPYKPLEQLQSNAQPNSDIYALGMVVVQVLTGLTTEELVKLQESTTEGGEFLWKKQVKVSNKLAEIIDRMIDYNYEKRYQNTAEVLDAFNGVSIPIPTSQNSGNYTEQFSGNSSLILNQSTLLLHSGFVEEQKNTIAPISATKSWSGMKIMTGLGVVLGVILGGWWLQRNPLPSFLNNQFNQDISTKRTVAEISQNSSQINPQQAQYYYQKGNSNYDHKQFAGAIENYTKSIELNSSQFEAYFNRGMAFFELQNYQEAIKDYSKAIELNPNDAEAYGKRGRTHLELKDYNNAISDYTEAIRRNANNEIAYISRGLARSAAGDKQGAMADYTQAIRLNPNSAEAYYSRGRARFFLADYQGSLEDYSEAIRINPQYVEAYSNRCGANLNLGQYQQAVEDCNRALQVNEKTQVAYENRCIAYYNLEQYQLAIEDCTKAILLTPNNSKIYSNRGLARAAAGDKTGAIEDYTKAIRVNPSDAVAYSNRAGVYASLDNLSNAIEDYSQAIRLKPDYNTAYYARGLLRANMGDKQGAQEDFQKASKLCLDKGNTGCYNDAQYQIKKII